MTISRMLILSVLFIAVLLAASIGTASGDAWVSSSALVNGLPSGIGESTPTVYNDSGVLKLISGYRYGTFIGYQWNGATWVSTPSLVVGLVDTIDYSSPCVYYKDGIFHLITGSKNGAFNGPFFGYQWNGTGWESNTTLVTGLSDVGATSTITVFYHDGTWKAITGRESGSGADFFGYYWSGSTWVSDSFIVTGLPTTLQWTSPSVYFDYNNDLKLISGTDNGNSYGYEWNGTIWIYNSAYDVEDVGGYSAPCVFYNLNNKINNIIGESSGVFYGYFFNYNPTTPTLVSPSNLSTQTSSPVTLSVSSTDADSDPITYYFYAGTSPTSMSFIGNNDLVGGNSFNWSISQYDEYYWTAFAGDGYENSSNMTTAQFTLFAPPDLTSPSNTSTIYTTYPPLTYNTVFTWQNTGAPSYRLVVAEDANFNIITVDTTIATNTSTQSLVVNDQYYWRVYSFDGSTYSDSSDIFNFNLTVNSTLTGSAIEGVVYTNGDGYTALSGAEVIIWNATWLDSAITGSNGYYVFEGLTSGEVYSLQAKADRYLTSSVAVITAGTDPITKNFYLLDDLTDTEWWHYVKFTLLSLNGTRYPTVAVNVYEGDSVTAYASGTTGTDGSITFHLNQNVKYRLTFIDATLGINKEIYLFPIDTKYYVYIDESVTFDPGNVSTNLTNYTTNYTTRPWSLQNLTSAEVNSTIGLGLLGQGIVASVVLWVVVGAGGLAVGIIAISAMAMLGIVTWVMVLFCGMTAVSLYILGSRIQ